MEIKDNVLNYGILITSLFILLIISSRSYIQKSSCEKNQDHKLENGKCVSTNKDGPGISQNPQQILPTPTPSNRKPTHKTINIKYLDTQNKEHFITTINEFESNLPVLYMNYLLFVEPDSTGKKELMAFDTTKMDPPSKFIYQIEPEIAEDLLNKSEAIYEQRNGPTLDFLQVIENNLFLFFGGYLSDGGIIKINLEKNEIYKYPSTFLNPRFKNVNNKYYLIEGEGDSCWSTTTIHNLNSDFKLGKSYTINSECSEGERILNYNDFSNSLVLYSYRSQGFVYLQPTNYIDTLINIDLATMKKTTIYDFRNEFKDGIFDAGIVTDDNQKQYYVFISVDGQPIIYDLNSKNIKALDTTLPIDQSLTNPLFSASMNAQDKIICLTQRSFSTTNNTPIYMAFYLEGKVLDNITSTNYCSNLYEEMIVKSNLDFDSESDNRVNSKLKYLESLDLPENIKIEVS